MSPARGCANEERLGHCARCALGVVCVGGCRGEPRLSQYQEGCDSSAGGVFDENAVGRINHAVVIVGWDDARSARHVRNSWGPDWGEDGYIWMRYGGNSIGAYAAWADARKIAKTSQPPGQLSRPLHQRTESRRASARR